MVAATPLAPRRATAEAPPALGALRALATRAARPPALRSLARVLRGARDAQEGFQQFRRLVALLFARADEAAILGRDPGNPFADYEGRCSRFIRRFEDRWFALWNGEDDIIGYGDDLPYEWVGGGSILEPQGVDYEALAEPDHGGYDTGLLALACLLAPDIDGQEARLDLLLADGALTPALAARLARPAPPLSVIRAATPPAWRETAVGCALWLYAATGNPFLDFALAEGDADYPTVDWHPAASRAPFAALRREYRAALDFHAGLGALVRAVAADPAAFVGAALPRLEAATARYLAGELPLAPDTAEAALAGVVAGLYADDEATGLRVWAGGGATPDPARIADLVAWQRSALLRELAATGLPLADDFEQGSCWRLADRGVALSQRRYRPSPHLQFAHEWGRSPLVARALHLLAGGRAERADAAAFRHDHPDVAAALGALRAALDGAGDEAPARLATSPHPALASHLAWLRGEPLGNPLLDRWPGDAPWSPAVRRVAATPDALAPWFAAAREAEARLADWATLRAALAGGDGADAARLSAEFAALATTLAGPTSGPTGAPSVAATVATTREE